MDKITLMSDLAQALSTKNIEQLEQLANQAVEAFPEDAFGYEYLAEFFLLTDPPNFPKAEQNIAKAIHFDPENASYLRKFGDMKAKQQLAEDARILYLKALKIEPNNVNSLVGIGLYQSRVARLFDEAVETLEKAAELDSNYPDINYFLAEAYHGAEKYDIAEEKIRASITEDRFELDKILFLINILDAAEKYGDVRNEFHKLIEKEPEDARFYLDYARYLFMDNQYDAVIDIMDKGLALSSDEVLINMLVHEPYFQSLLKEGENDKLLAKIQAALVFAPEEKAFYLYSAKAKEAKGDMDGALEDYQKLKELSSTKIQITKYNFEIAKLLLNNGKVAEAKKIIAEVEAVDKILGEFGKAMLLYKENKLDESYKRFKDLVKKGSIESKEFIVEHLGDYLKEKKQAILAKHSSDIEKNGSAENLSKLFGKFYKFSDFDANGKTVDDKIKKYLFDSLKDYSVVMTASGAIFFNPSSALQKVFTYKIVNSSADKFTLQCFPLDGDEPFSIKMVLQGDILRLESDEKFTFIMKEEQPSHISAEAKTVMAKEFDKEDLSFLGNSAKTVLDEFFSVL